MTALSTPPAPATNVELIRWAFDRLNAHDVDSIRRFWTADTVEHFNDVTCRGTDEIAASFEATFAAVPDFHLDVRSVVGDEKVVSDTVVFDQLTFARQVGMMPAEGTPGDRAAEAAFAARLKIARRLRRR